MKLICHLGILALLGLICLSGCQKVKAPTKPSSTLNSEKSIGD